MDICSNQYLNSCIYKIYCKDLSVTDFYIGATKNLTNRVKQHFYNVNNPRSVKGKFKVYNFIREHGGVDNWNVVALKFLSVKDKKALDKVEGEFIKKYRPTLNCVIVGRTRHEYIDDNREKVNECNKKSYRKHRDKHREHKKKIYQENKEAICKKQKEYYEKNKEEITKRRAYEFNCICGKKIQIQNRKAHIASKQHHNDLSKIMSDKMFENELKICF